MEKARPGKPTGLSRSQILERASHPPPGHRFLYVAKSRGRRPLPRSHYEKVAAVYLEALHDNQDPTQAVRDHFIISKSQAAKWIYRCRRPPLNLLDPTTRGRRAGGPGVVGETSERLRGTTTASAPIRGERK